MKKLSLFISHAHQFRNQYEDLVQELREVGRLDFEDMSISADDPLPQMKEGQLKRKLNNQIRVSSAVLFIGGLFVPDHEWIMYEWWAAERWRKRRIVVRQRHQRFVPEQLYREADHVVEWDGLALAKVLLKSPSARRA